MQRRGRGRGAEQKEERRAKNGHGKEGAIDFSAETCRMRSKDGARRRLEKGRRREEREEAEKAKHWGRGELEKYVSLGLCARRLSVESKTRSRKKRAVRKEKKRKGVRGSRGRGKSKRSSRGAGEMTQEPMDKTKKKKR